MRYLTIVLGSLVLATGSFASEPAGYRMTTDSVYRHIAVLASDSLEGREVGEAGEWKASQYIISIFKAAGLEPKGDDGSFLQPFEFTKRVDEGPENRLRIAGRELLVQEDFQPLQHSNNGRFEFDTVVYVGYGIVTADSSHDDYAGLDVAGRAVLIRRYAPESASQDSDTTAVDTTYDRYRSLVSKISTALDHGAKGIFFYTPATHDDTILSRDAQHITPKDVPVIFLRRAGLEKIGQPLEEPLLTDVSGQTDLIRVRDTGYNVVGYLPGDDATVSIIGAHYDHLGWGTSSSRYLGAEKKIHYGADDNGSGTAALLELARYFADPAHHLTHSLLFIAFSGEESGTLGSGHYVRNWTVDKAQTKMMVNMDMIGRLADQESGLAIMGTGTCQEFKDYFEGLELVDLKTVFKESGAGPSDHTAFYHDSIPSLHFFTGAHKDYHTPDDVAEKIDSRGIVTVADLVADIVTHFDEVPGPLTFLRTKDDRPGGARGNLSVTLGIMPDFISELEGLGVDGVTPDKPGDRAGLLRGDVIIRMDQRKVGDIYDYMNALGKYRKGDTCNIMVVRSGDKLSMQVEF
jgi:hypothetical protein